MKGVQITVYSPPDEQGRQSFDTLWTDEQGRQRGQCFYTQVDKHIERLRELHKDIDTIAIKVDGAYWSK